MELTWRAHGWTADAFRRMILDVQMHKEIDDRKLICTGCGRVYMVPADYVEPTCLLCTER